MNRIPEWIEKIDSLAIEIAAGKNYLCGLSYPHLEGDKVEYFLNHPWDWFTSPVEPLGEHLRDYIYLGDISPWLVDQTLWSLAYRYAEADFDQLLKME